MSDGKGFGDKGSTKLLYNDQELMFLLKLYYLSFVSWCFDIVKCLCQVPYSKLPMIKINHLIYQFNALLFSLPFLCCKDKNILLIIGMETGHMAFNNKAFCYVAVKIQQLKIKRAITKGKVHNQLPLCPGVLLLPHVKGNVRSPAEIRLGGSFLLFILVPMTLAKGCLLNRVSLWR